LSLWVSTACSRPSGSALRPEEIEDAEIDAAIAEHEAWKAAGRPGGTIPHEIVMAELLGDGR